MLMQCRLFSFAGMSLPSLVLLSLVSYPDNVPTGSYSRSDAGDKYTLLLSECRI